MSAILTLPSVIAHEWMKEHSHGLVFNRPDGARARCMGPTNPEFEGHKGCQQCDYEQMIVGLLVECRRITRDECGPDCNLTTYAEQET